VPATAARADGDGDEHGPEEGGTRHGGSLRETGRWAQEARVYPNGAKLAMENDRPL
jgi:hypothetical protein